MEIMNCIGGIHEIVGAPTATSAAQYPRMRFDSRANAVATRSHSAAPGDRLSEGAGRPFTTVLGFAFSVTPPSLSGTRVTPSATAASTTLRPCRDKPSS
jgi:hypothetical protein